MPEKLLNPPTLLYCCIDYKFIYGVVQQDLERKSSCFKQCGQNMCDERHNWMHYLSETL